MPEAPAGLGAGEPASGMPHPGQRLAVAMQTLAVLGPDWGPPTAYRL